MTNQSDTRGNTGSENRENMDSQWDEEQSGKNTQQSNSNQSKSNTQSSGSGSSSNRPGGIREGEPNGPQHTNAGNTGVSSDQISPKTQNQQVPSRTSGTSSGSEHNR